MTTRIKSPRKRKSTSTVKLRTNGKHKIDAASTIRAPIGMDRILRPQARFNWLMPNVASITPQYIEMLLNGALAGNHVQRWELFDLMLRTWPELSACCQELTYGVLRKKLVYEPFHEEDEKPTPSAIERMKVCSAALRRMAPSPTTDGADLNGTIRDILDAWFRGCSVSEIIWDTVDDKVAGTITAPSCTYWVYPVCYAFTSDNTIGMMPPTISKGGTWPFSSTSNVPTNQAQVIPFPDNKFLVSVHKTKSGSPLSGPLLVPLCWWWCAANFSSDWLLNLAQVFGLPFRFANFDPNAPDATIAAIATMMQNMGSNGWGMFPTGTEIELINASTTGSDHTPQGELLDRADRYARNLILGQTMTGTHGTTGKGGGQAFGEVEADVKSDRIDAAGAFASEIINNQLIKFVLMLNYGDTEEPPTIKFLEDDVAGLPQANTYKTLADAGLEIGVDHIRKVFDIPEPAEGEETIGGEKPQPDFGQFGGSFGPDSTGAQDKPGEPPSDSADVQASDQTGHPFRGNQYVSLGSMVETPHGTGTVVANDRGGAWVSVNGQIRKYKYGEIKRAMKPFPSLLPSEENKRRLMRNAGLQTKLLELNAIKDDAVFARELEELSKQLVIDRTFELIAATPVDPSLK